MLSLGLELIAIFLLVAVIGILMGRFLCKSGESEEREKRKKVIYAYESTLKELEFQKNRVEEYATQLQLKEDYIAQCEQNIHSLNTKLDSSNQERKQLLEELKVLDKYKSKFESLDKEFKIHSKMLEQLKDEKINNQKEIANFKILTNELNKNINSLEENREELEKEILSLNNQLKEQKEHYERLIQQINELHEEDKSKALKEYQEIKSDYENFVETHNLDSDRLLTLEIENEKMYHLLNSVEIERDDLLNRLRAISSVVEAVGIEQVKDESQILLENR